MEELPSYEPPANQHEILLRKRINKQTNIMGIRLKYMPTVSQNQASFRIFSYYLQDFYRLFVNPYRIKPDPASNLQNLVDYDQIYWTEMSPKKIYKLATYFKMLDKGLLIYSSLLSSGYAVYSLLLTAIRDIRIGPLFSQVQKELAGRSLTKFSRLLFTLCRLRRKILIREYPSKFQEKSRTLLRISKNFPSYSKVHQSQKKMSKYNRTRRSKALYFHPFAGRPLKF